jgi:predicted nucleotidyltransferase
MDQTTAITLGKAYKELIMQHLNVEEVILYGSYGKGTPHPDSDIDIAIVVDSIKGDYFDTVPLLWKLKRQISNLIEPILISEEDDRSGFLESIRKNGIVL